MNGAFFAASFLFLLSPLAADLQYSGVYQADELPEKSSPKWASKGNSASVEIADSSLNVQSEGANKRQFYVADQIAGWDMSSGLATVEFRLKCSSTDPEDEVFRVQLSDGSKMWRAVFFPQRCNGAKVETDDWDTYRLVVRDGRMEISSEKLGVIAENVESAPFTEDQALLFGTFKGSPSSASRTWNIDFVRWTNDEARLVKGASSAP